MNEKDPQRTSLDDLLDLPGSVNLGRGNMELRPLGAEDVAILLGTYKDQFVAFFTGGMNPMSIVMAAPKLTVDIIVMSSERESEREKISRMGIQRQADCLGAIYKLSVPDEKKFYQSLVQVAEKLRAARSAMEEPSGSNLVTGSQVT